MCGLGCFPICLCIMLGTQGCAVYAFIFDSRKPHGYRHVSVQGVYVHGVLQDRYIHGFVKSLMIHI